MRVNSTTQSGQAAYTSTLDGSRSSAKIKEATQSLGTVKQVGKDFQSMTKAAEKLASPAGFKDEASYTSALKEFTTAYNATRTSAKAAGGTEGRQVSQAMDRVAGQLARGAEKSGFQVKKDGTLTVNEDEAKAAFKAAGSKATATFSGGVSDRLSQAKGAITTTLDSRSRRLSADIENTTRQQVMVDKVSARMASTYGAKGELSGLSGPAAIYQLM